MPAAIPQTAFDEDSKMQLRPYQIDGITRIKTQLRQGAKSCVLVAPTGSGKTVVSSEIMRSAVQKGSNILFLAHRIELITQTCDKLSSFDLQHKIYAPEKDIRMITQKQVKKYGKSRVDPFAKIAVGTVQTVSRRLDKITPPDLIIIDETHLAIANSYQKVREAFPKAILIGLTATPCRLDGRGLGEMFEKITVLATAQEIADMGFLVPFRAFSASETVNLANIKTTMGDYDKKQLAEEMEKPRLIGNAVDHYKKLSHKRPAIAFCVSVKHAEQTAAAFRASGYKSIAVSGESSSDERTAAIDGLATGEYDVVCNCGLYIEGLDQPCISCVILLAPTKSLSRYLQSVGRGSRPADNKKDCIILDHAGNVLRHGFPYDDREWSLDGAKKKKRGKKDDESDVNITTCTECFAIFKKELSHCPACGTLVKKLVRKDIEHEDGELVELDPLVMRAQRKKEQSQAKTYDELLELAIKRGYNYPKQWVNHILKSRGAYGNRG